MSERWQTSLTAIIETAMAVTDGVVLECLWWRRNVQSSGEVGQVDTAHLDEAVKRSGEDQQLPLDLLTGDCFSLQQKVGDNLIN